MNRNQAEKMLKRLAEAAEMLSCAQATLAETNATLVDVLLQAMANAASADDTPQTMQ